MTEVSLRPPFSSGSSMCRMNSSHAGMQRTSLSVNSSTTSVCSFMNAIRINQIIPGACFIDTVLHSSSEPGIEICTNKQYRGRRAPGKGFSRLLLYGSSEYPLLVGRGPDKKNLQSVEEAYFDAKQPSRSLHLDAKVNVISYSIQFPFFLYLFLDIL
jgi:hypothetical protein